MRVVCPCKYGSDAVKKHLPMVAWIVAVFVLFAMFASSKSTWSACLSIIALAAIGFAVGRYYERQRAERLDRTAQDDDE